MNDRASRRAPQAGDTELSGPPAAEAIAPQVLRETASWLLLMQEGPLPPCLLYTSPSPRDYAAARMP
ncbi:hypothetical protein KZ847_34325, partial [Pseudomonas aeruginosa]|nr:hypothetical protein [Pseudomonas aeruginosa]